MVILFGIVYLAFIGISIVAPVSELKKLTKEEIDDHEYDKIVISDETSEEFGSQM